MLPTTTYPQSPEALTSLLKAALRSDTEILGLAIKVRGSKVTNWMFADVSTLKSIATLKAGIVFRYVDSSNYASTLRDLTTSLTDKTPLLALMVRFDKNSDAPQGWEFVDLNFLRNITSQ